MEGKSVKELKVLAREKSDEEFIEVLNNHHQTEL